MVHQYKNNGYNIVLDVNSGSVHVVDDLVYDVLEEISNRMDTEDDIDTIDICLLYTSRCV